MPIHDQGYRRYRGRRVPVGHAWSVIARAGLRALLAKRTFLALLLVAWFPFFVRSVQKIQQEVRCGHRVAHSRARGSMLESMSIWRTIASLPSCPSGQAFG